MHPSHRPRRRSPRAYRLLDIARTQQLVRVGAEEEHGVGPVLQEVLVIELLANDVVHPGKAYQAIGVGIGLQPLVGLPGLGDADGINDDELRGIGLVDRRASRDDAPEGRLGCIGLLAALAPVDNRVRLLWGCWHHGLDGPSDHGHVERVVPAPADGARIDDVAGIAQEVGETAARPQMIRAVGTLGGDECLGAIFVDECLKLLGDFLDGLIVGNLLPLVLATLANTLERMIDALGVIMELDRALALLAQAVAEHGALRVIAPELHEPAGFRVDTGIDAAVHVAEVATSTTPSNAIVIYRVVGHAGHRWCI